MAFKKFNLFLIGVLIVALFFSLPVNNKWLSEKIFCESCGIFTQARALGVDQRMSIRFGASYDACKAIEKMIEDSKVPNPVVLMPANSYLTAMKVQGGISIPEPAVFYYFTGIKSVSAFSPGRDEANFVLVAKDNRVWLRPIENKAFRDSLFNIYKKYRD